MTNIFPLILSFIAGISTVIGSLFIFLKLKKVGEFIVFSLSFSLGIMTLISLFDLIPSSYPIIIDNYELGENTLNTDIPEFGTLSAAEQVLYYNLQFCRTF